MLKQIRMVNCQSFEDVTLNLSDSKINVLVADNSTGKSVLFKMLKVTASPTYFSRDELKELIRRDSEEAMILFQFDDDSIGATIITKSNVIYKYKEAGVDTFYSYLEPPKELLDKLGLITNSNDFVANIIDTDQDMLLVNSNLKGNGDLIELVAENPTLKELDAKCDAVISEFKNYYSRVLSLKDGISSQLNTLEYTDIGVLQRNLDMQSLCYETCLKLLDVQDLLNKLAIYTVDNNDYSMLLKLFDLLIFSIDIQKVIQMFAYKKSTIDGFLFNSLNKFFHLQQIVSQIKIIKEYDNFLLEQFDKLKLIQNYVSEISIVDSSAEEITVAFGSFIKLYNFYKNIKDVLFTLEKEQEVCITLQNYLSEFSKEGNIVECPVYGEVIYDGKECLPYN